MPVKLSPFGPKPQFMLATGLPAVGAQLFFYVGGSSTKQNTYTDSTGGSANTNPIVLNSLGEPATQIWFTAGQTYKAVLAPVGDTDPPASPVWTVDNISGINDSSVSGQDEWVASGLTPTYVSASSFTLVGDQTSTATVGRRCKFTVTAGTVYGRISVSAFTALTTVTVILDSGALDSGLSAVSYGILQANNSSIPFTKASSSGLVSAFGYVNRSALAGLTMSTGGGSATISVAAGEATDSTNVANIALAAAISKTTSAWAVGSAAGGLDTGAIANSTWYHFYLIMRPDTGVVDVLFSLSATAPTMPANYTLKRRIGSWITTAGGNWDSITQDGDYFRWAASKLEFGDTNPGTASITKTLANVPTGVNVQAILNWEFNSGAGGGAAGYVRDLAANDEAVSGTAAPLASFWINASSNGAEQIMTRTNTSAQLAYRLVFSDASIQIRAATLGWYDRRGRDA